MIFKGVFLASPHFSPALPETGPFAQYETPGQQHARKHEKPVQRKNIFQIFQPKIRPMYKNKKHGENQNARHACPLQTAPVNGRRHFTPRRHLPQPVQHGAHQQR
nr:hypothetical protein [uncultured Ottowia sp.]